MSVFVNRSIAREFRPLFFTFHLPLFKIRMREVDAVVKDGGLAKDQVLRPDLIILLGIFAPIKPREVSNGRAVCKVSHNPFLTRPHGERLKTQDLTDHLHIRHVAREFVDGVDLRAVHVFIGIVFQQVTIGLKAELVAQHLLAVRPYAWQVHDVLIQNALHR